MKVFALFGGKQVVTCRVKARALFSFSDWLRSLENQQKVVKTLVKEVLSDRLLSAKRMECECVVSRRRKRQNSDTVLDDRDDFSNGRPMRMKKTNRKRRSLQKKRLMGSTESLGGLEELAASRASKNNNFTLQHCVILLNATRESHNVANVVFFL